MYNDDLLKHCVTFPLQKPKQQPSVEQVSLDFLMTELFF